MLAVNSNVGGIKCDQAREQMLVCIGRRTMPTEPCKALYGSQAKILVHELPVPNHCN